MEQLIQFLLTTEYAQYVIMAMLVCRFITMLPVSITEKIPNGIMQVINVAALSSNKLVDNQGNRK